MKVSVITATTGNKHLASCIESVRNQTYPNVEHIVVVDGQERLEKCAAIFQSLSFGKSNANEHALTLPYATGTDRYNGHRIYGAFTFIANGDYHIWLDDDNTLEQNHIEGLVNLVKKSRLHWAYSLRKIIDKDNNVICLDDCESLGKWASILDKKDFFVDVNCYFVAKPVAIKLAPIWYRKAREPGQIEVDRALAAMLMHPKNKLNYDCSNDYTVGYRVGNTHLSAKSEFFLNGNRAMLQRHNGILPWKK